MRVCFIRHESDEAFVKSLEPLLASHEMERREAPDGSDVVVVLASSAALRDGLGDGPQKAIAAGVATLPVVLGDDVVPRPYLAARKHIAIATDAPSMLRLLEDHRKNAAQKIADGKRELFGYGLLLAMLARPPR